MRNQAIAELYIDKLFINMCRKYGREDNEELRSEVISILLEMSDEKINHIIENGYILPYAINIIRLQSISKRDTFNKNFNHPFKFAIDIEELELIDESVNAEEIEYKYLQADKLIDKIKNDSLDQYNEHFYGSRLALLKVEHGSIKAVSRSTGIPYRSMQDALKKYVNYLKQWQKK